MKKILFFLTVCFFVKNIQAQLVDPVNITNPIMLPNNSFLTGEYNGHYIFLKDRLGVAGNHDQIFKVPVADDDGIYYESQETLLHTFPNRSGGTNIHVGVLTFDGSFLKRDHHLYTISSSGCTGSGVEIGRFDLQTETYDSNFMGASQGANWLNLYFYNNRVYALVALIESGSRISINCSTDPADILVENDSPFGVANEKIQAALISFDFGSFANPQLEYHFKDPTFQEDYLPTLVNSFTNGGSNVLFKFQYDNPDIPGSTSYRNNSYYIQYDMDSGNIVNRKDFIGNTAFLMADNGEFITAENFVDNSGTIEHASVISRWDSNWNLLQREENMFVKGPYGSPADPRGEINGIIQISPTKYLITKGYNDTGGLDYTYQYSVINADDLRRTESFSAIETDLANLHDFGVRFKKIWNVDETGFNFSFFMPQQTPAYNAPFSGFVTLGGHSLECPLPENYVTNSSVMHRSRRTFYGRYNFMDISDKNLEIPVQGPISAVHTNSKLVNNTIVPGDAFEMVVETTDMLTVGDNINLNYFNSHTQSSGWNVIYGQSFNFDWLFVHPHDLNLALIREKDGVMFVDIQLTSYPESAELRSALVYSHIAHNKTYRVYLVNPDDLSVEDQNLAEVSVYPNPTKGDLFIKGINARNMEISIYSMLGQKVLNTRLANVNNIIHVSLGDLEKGVYMVNIKTEKGIKKTKIIKH